MSLFRDLRVAFYSLLRTKGLAITVILTLALGIGANAAIFTLVRGVLLKPLVNRDEDRLIYIRQGAPGIGDDNETFSVPEIHASSETSNGLIGAEGFTGCGSIIGIVDWGCDFAHVNFRDKEDTSRIHYLWDQRGGRHGIDLAAIEPQIERVGRKHHRHPVVQRCKLPIGRGGDDGGGFQLLAVGPHPGFP